MMSIIEFGKQVDVDLLDFCSRNHFLVTWTGNNSFKFFPPFLCSFARPTQINKYTLESCKSHPILLSTKSDLNCSSTITKTRSLGCLIIQYDKNKKKGVNLLVIFLLFIISITRVQSYKQYLPLYTVIN